GNAPEPAALSGGGEIEEAQQQREEKIGEEVRPLAPADGRGERHGKREEDGHHERAAAPRQGEVHQRDDGGNHQGAKPENSPEAAGAPEPVEQELGEPFVSDPWFAGGGVAEGVGGGDAVGGGDDRPRLQMPPEVGIAEPAAERLSDDEDQQQPEA